MRHAVERWETVMQRPAFADPVRRRVVDWNALDQGAHTGAARPDGDAGCATQVVEQRCLWRPIPGVGSHLHLATGLLQLLRELLGPLRRTGHQLAADAALRAHQCVAAVYVLPWLHLEAQLAEAALVADWEPATSIVAMRADRVGCLVHLLQ